MEAPHVLLLGSGPISLMHFCLKENTRMMIKKCKTRPFAFSGSFRLQASGYLQTRWAASISPLTWLKGLENHKVSRSDTCFEFIKTTLQTLVQHALDRKNAYTFARHAVWPFFLSKAKYPPAECTRLISPDPGYTHEDN